MIYKILPFFTGLVNSLFGAGGGIVAVGYLKTRNLEQKNAQATALVTTFVLSILSSLYYMYQGYVELSGSLVYLPFGIIGAITGGFLLKRTPDVFLKKAFALLILFSGYRMLTAG